ncbi:IS110 family transposase [Lentzea alba]|uniref:IS110 family transposase n=1 Tax=Lentzea alba TaxID=2714351 RepID=UPI0039BF1BA0
MLSALSIKAPVPRCGSNDEELRVPAAGCGVNWAETHHDVPVVDEHGSVIVAERIGKDAAGLPRLLEILAEHDPDEGDLVVAIMTGKGLLVAGATGRGRQVFVISMVAGSRWVAISGSEVRSGVTVAVLMMLLRGG